MNMKVSKTISKKNEITLAGNRLYVGAALILSASLRANTFVFAKYFSPLRISAAKSHTLHFAQYFYSEDNESEESAWRRPSYMYMKEAIWT